MSAKNTLFAAAVVVSGAVSATLGMVARDRVDLPYRETAVAGQIPGTRMASTQDPQGIDIPEREYFEQMVEMLKQGYVEPIEDDQKLVAGAVRGMIGSLEDPNSLFYDKDEFRVFQNAREGNYEGIGVDLVYVLPPKKEGPDQGARIPKLVVAAVVPNGPAAKAGVLPGDVVDTVDGKWVVNLDLLDKFRALQKAVDEKKASPADLAKLRNDLRSKSEHSILPSKARDRLVQGTSGSMTLTLLRGGASKDVTVAKALSVVAPVVANAGQLKVRLMPGVGVALAKALPKSGSVTIDLRNNAFADLSTVIEAMAALAPTGKYGPLLNDRGGSIMINVPAGRSGGLQCKLVVDSSTRGGAALLANALKQKGLATLEGTPSTSANAIEVSKLPDGSGFTLAKGHLKEVAK